jgi:hypothetical protein
VTAARISKQVTISSLQPHPPPISESVRYLPSSRTASKSKTKLSEFLSLV